MNFGMKPKSLLAYEIIFHAYMDRKKIESVRALGIDLLGTALGIWDGL